MGQQAFPLKKWLDKKFLYSFPQENIPVGDKFNDKQQNLFVPGKYINPLSHI
jgi:hypothetical protein